MHQSQDVQMAQRGKESTDYCCTHEIPPRENEKATMIHATHRDPFSPTDAYDCLPHTCSHLGATRSGPRRHDAPDLQPHVCCLHMTSPPRFSVTNRERRKPMSLKQR
ncbi:hypothetical protein LI328DRAFT_12019 [Trichoderma asperelloides]|nr:hypothetical protein LI328DRAFT_12019 [Trichoderma asperelloides]